MKEVVLLIGHGSRDDEGNREFLRFVEQLRQDVAEQEIVACFLEFAEPDIAAGIETCMAMGAARIVAVPVILLAASHVKLEIPEHLAAARDRHPGVEIVYGRNIGLHERLLDLLTERFAEQTAELDEKALRQTAIVLMGRGSSDPDANGDVYKIARVLWERTGVLTVETCFTGITFPRLPEGVARAVRLGAQRVIVVPYFLFTGVLIKRMQALLQSLQPQYPEVPLQMAGYFGLHSYLQEVVVDRVIEAGKRQSFMNCDLCRYRLQAVYDDRGHLHHDHHHHRDGAVTGHR